MIELIDINYEVNGKKILNNINLKIEKNQFIVITGPNGSGKSTLAKIIAGLVKETSGKIIYDGIDITNFTLNERANIGITYAFQNPIKFKGISVYDILNISSPTFITKKQAKDNLKLVGLNEEYIDRQLDDTLSGGEQKRIEIAGVISRTSDLTIFDEPEAGIDLWSFNELIDLFKKIKQEKQGLTLIISHQEKIMKNADKIILIKKGQIVSIEKYESLEKSGVLV
ncbi:MAG: ATP-binding cassette domain-containing protein [Mycoplasmatota bacterium]